jgi:hypothetical protein
MPPKQFRKIAATMKPMMAPGKLADHRASQDQETAKAPVQNPGMISEQPDGLHCTS